MVQRAILLAAGLVLAAGVTAAAATGTETQADAAVHYIISLQNPDGGFPAFGEESAPGSTIDAIFALIAAGYDPTPVYNKGASPVDYLVAQASAYASDPGAAAKLALAVAVMARDPSIGLDLRDFGGVDLLSIMSESYDAETGAYGLDLFDETFYILALVAAGEPVPDALYQHLHSRRAEDGGWEFSPGAGSDTNTTAMVAQALIAAGAPDDDHAVGAALNYLRYSENDDAGFGFAPGEDSDPNSTALAIQTLAAAGGGLSPTGLFARDGRMPLDALLSFRNPATGAFQYAGEDSAFATYQAVPALLLAPFPDLVAHPELKPETTAAAPEPTTTAPRPRVPATAQPERPAELPDAGSGAQGGSVAWPAAVALLASAGLALGAGAYARRRR